MACVRPAEEMAYKKAVSLKPAREEVAALIAAGASVKEKNEEIKS